MSTIFALSSGSLPSGVAVVRLSGPECFAGLKSLSLVDLAPRKMLLRDVKTANSQEKIDRGLVCIFPKPHSFTGEDCAEIHIHGGRAVVSKLLSELSLLSGFRLAEAGEFSRRAFENGKLDLTEIEGLGDLIAADTESQRKQALLQASGVLREKLESWREDIIRCRAFLEAEFDFSDEDDVPDSMRDYIETQIEKLVGEIGSFLEDGRRGEIVRDGFKVVLTGPPNAGKSSLMNALAGRDVAIVSTQAGTTRDVLECSIDLDGYLVTLVDTAGIRESDNEIEIEGIKRAIDQSEKADLTIWLSSADSPTDPSDKVLDPVVVVSKDDLAKQDPDIVSFNTKSEEGLESFLSLLRSELNLIVGAGNRALITRERHRMELDRCRDALIKCQKLITTNPVICGEELRIAGDCIGRLTGHIDVEDLLDVIFSEFCVGK